MTREPFFDLSLDFVCVAGLDGYFRRVNPTFLRTLGYSEEELLARPFLEFVHPDDRDPTLAALEQLGSGANVVNFGNRYRCKDGSYRWLEWSTPAPPEGSDELYAVARDVTEQREIQRELLKAKEEAEVATEAKGQFLANVSHEIRTPMNAILGLSELLANTELTPEQRDFLRMIRESSEALLRLINDLLDVSKIEAGKLELEAIGFDLRECVGRGTQSLAIRAAEKGLELQYRIAPDVPARVVGDPGRLRQIVTNLVGNAIKFTHEGEILVDVEAEARAADTVRLRFTVTDTGIGIAPGKQQEVFEAFRQADASTTRRYGGTGLGLSIASELVQLMGGRIWIESQEGQGTRCRFTAELGLEVTPRERPHPSELSGRRILVVDDNATNRRILDEVLHSWNAEPTLVTDGPAALRELHSSAKAGRPYRTVILDCMMPDMDGFTLAERILDDGTLPRPAMIMMSSAALPEHAERSRELGIARYLTKPVVQSDLLDTLVAVIRGETIGAAGSAALSGRGKDSDQRKSLQERAAGLRVLVAEDGVVNQRVARGLLESIGHDVTVVCNGREAVNICEGREFDLVLMDVQMPEMDGLEATVEIRRREAARGGRVPILAMTAAALPEDMARCMEAGMDGHLAKPIDALRLERAIGKIARGRAAPSDVFDLAIARQRIPGGEAGLTELAALMLGETPGLLREIESARSECDVERLGRAVHTLKGSASAFGARRVVEAAERLEAALGSAAGGGEESPEQLDQGLLDLRRDTHAFLDALRSAVLPGSASGPPEPGTGAGTKRG